MPFPAFAKIRGDIELLRFISENCTVDIDLKTWKGNAKIKCSVTREISEGSEKKSNLKREWEDEVEFVIDRSINCIRWNKVTVKGFVEEHNEVMKIGPISSAGITNGEYDYIMSPFQKGENTERSLRTMYIKNKQFTERNILTNIFDPLYVLERELGYSKLSKKFRFYFEKADTLKNTEGSVERNGNIVIFQTVSKTEKNDKFGDIVTRYVFDLSKGCNIIELCIENAKNKRYWSLDYEKMENIFVLKKISMIYENKRPESKMVSKREVILTTNYGKQTCKISGV